MSAKRAHPEDSDWTVASKKRRRQRNVVDKPTSAEPVLVDTVKACKKAVAALLGEAQVAIDIEGVKLGRAPGKICILQAFGAGTCYLFDISVLQDTAFDEGGLRELFGSETVVKIFYDTRGDCDALYHNHGVKKVKKAYDLQVLYHILFAPDATRLQGLQKAMSIYEKSDAGMAIESLEELKKAGLRLFAPDHGGSHSVWEQRPLSSTLITYCAADVEYLMKMRDLWGNKELDECIFRITEKRIANFVAKSVIDQGSKGIVDFSVSQECLSFVRMPSGLEVKIMRIGGREGRVIGPKGSTLQRICRESRASCSVQGDSVRIIGLRAEVEEAQCLVNAVL